jgi:hypothetical protein
VEWAPCKDNGLSVGRIKVRTDRRELTPAQDKDVWQVHGKLGFGMWRFSEENWGIKFV